MLTKASMLMRGLKSDGEKQWLGSRPSLAGSHPVIGPSSSSPAVIYAFGHGHCGLTQKCYNNSTPRRDCNIGKTKRRSATVPSRSILTIAK